MGETGKKEMNVYLRTTRMCLSWLGTPLADSASTATLSIHLNKVSIKFFAFVLATIYHHF